MDREAALRAGYDALNRRDFDALLKLFDSKVEFGDELVAFVRERGTGSGSAVSLDQLTYHVFMFQGEKVVRFRWFHDRDQALDAAGAHSGASGERS